VFSCFTFDYFVLVLIVFVVLGVVSSVLRQEIGWEERSRKSRSDLFCVEWHGRKSRRRDGVRVPKIWSVRTLMQIITKILLYYRSEITETPFQQEKSFSGDGA